MLPATVGARGLPSDSAPNHHSQPPTSSGRAHAPPVRLNPKRKLERRVSQPTAPRIVATPPPAALTTRTAPEPSAASSVREPARLRPAGHQPDSPLVRCSPCTSSQFEKESFRYVQGEPTLGSILDTGPDPATISLHPPPAQRAEGAPAGLAIRGQVGRSGRGVDPPRPAPPPLVSAAAASPDLRTLLRPKGHRHTMGLPAAKGAVKARRRLRANRGGRRHRRRLLPPVLAPS
ncbi:uncharacterized protein LOC109703817 [Ananas comosus]|uniref:Uncharacterized protein LOC109703817 n=1 Tax=Ananas comosus TaxID=4615 RepID=A0A6P5EAN3_ANACO|nr:uncharacterized protein LOC109703817 [Ananas comosus]